MSKQQRLQHKHSSAKEKLLLNDLISFCRLGRDFYSRAANRAEQQMLRNLLMEIAADRHQMLMDLATTLNQHPELMSESDDFYGSIDIAANDSSEQLFEKNTSPQENSSYTSTLSQIFSWYQQAIYLLENDQYDEFVSHMLDEEYTALSKLKQAARRLKDQKLAYILVSHIASIQIAFDEIRDFHESYFA